MLISLCDFASNYSVGEFVDVFLKQKTISFLDVSSAARLNFSFSGAVIKQVVTSLIQRVIFIYLVEKR